MLKSHSMHNISRTDIDVLIPFAKNNNQESI